jgi:hypothetical protein
MPCYGTTVYDEMHSNKKESSNMKSPILFALVICLTASMLLPAKAGSWKAPNLPQGVTMKSGEEYYALNVGTGWFLSEEFCNWSPRSALSPIGLRVKPILIRTLANGDNVYAIQDSSFVLIGWGYLYAEDVLVAKTIAGEPKSFWTIKESDKNDKTYTIQISPDNENFGTGTAYEGSYLGYAELADYEAIKPLLSMDDAQSTSYRIFWKFITPKDYQMYRARMELYDMLNWAEKAGVTTTDAETVYNSQTSSEEDLRTITGRLRKALTSDALKNAKKATATAPKDVTALISNPFFNTDHNDWEMNGEVIHGNYGRWFCRCIEGYFTRNFYCKQRIYLPAGVYGLGVKGFYRSGSLPTAESMNSIGTEQHNAYLFAGNDSVLLESIFSGASNGHTIKTGEQLSSTNFEAGDIVILETIAATNYNADLRHGNYFNSESAVSIPTSHLTNTNRFEIVDARKTVNGHPTYYLRNLTHGHYISASNTRNSSMDAGPVERAANFEIISYEGNSANVSDAKGHAPGLNAKSVMFKYTPPKGSPYPALYLSYALKGMDCHLWNDNDSWATWNMYRAIDFTGPKIAKIGKWTLQGYIPSNLSQVRAYFDAGAYNNLLMFYKPQAGPITIGINKPTSLAADWTVISDWSLTCYGNGEDAKQLLPKR